MDERQVQVRGRICFKGCIGTIVYLLLVALLNDFDILNIQKVFGVSNFLIASAMFLLLYISLATIWKDAYFGVDSIGDTGYQMKAVCLVFTILAIFLDILQVFDLLRGECPTITTLATLLLVNSIALSLWFKRWEYGKR